MKQIKKVFIWAGILAGAMFMIGCEGGEENASPSPLPTQKSMMKTLSIYTIDSDTMSLVPVTVEKRENTITPAYITSLVEGNLEDDAIRVYSAEQENERIILSFYADGKPFVNCSRKMENLILDCFANSLLDNLDNCSEIVFRCEDRAYKSEHYSFKKNEVYASE